MWAVRRPWAAWMTLGLAADPHVGLKPPSGRGVHAEIGAMAACGPIAVGVAFTPCVLCRRGASVLTASTAVAGV